MSVDLPTFFAQMIPGFLVITIVVCKVRELHFRVHELQRVVNELNAKLDKPVDVPASVTKSDGQAGCEEPLPEPPQPLPQARASFRR